MSGKLVSQSPGDKSDAEVVKNKGGRPKKKHAGGRPSVMTPETLKKLEDAFKLGCTDSEACFAADISPASLYTYCKANPSFAERKQVLKERPIYMARAVLIGALEDKDVNTAHKVIERKDGTKNILAGDPNNPMLASIKVSFVKSG